MLENFFIMKCHKILSAFFLNIACPWGTSSNILLINHYTVIKNVDRIINTLDRAHDPQVSEGTDQDTQLISKGKGEFKVPVASPMLGLTKA